MISENVYWFMFITIKDIRHTVNGKLVEEEKSGRAIHKVLEIIIGKYKWMPRVGLEPTR
jgi:hypothetical protein